MVQYMVGYIPCFPTASSSYPTSDGEGTASFTYNGFIMLDVMEKNKKRQVTVELELIIQKV